MSEPLSICVFGAGAMGAAFAAKFYDLDPGCVSVIAAGERYARLTREGVTVNGQHYPVRVVTPDDTAPPDDLILVALKHQHLVADVDQIRHRVGPDTTLISVMNGLDSEPILAEAYGADKVLYAISVGIDAQRQGTHVNYSKLGTIFFGEADNTHISDRVKAMQSLFDRAGIAYQTPPDMLRQMWWKFMINVGVNQASSVLDAPYGIFHESPHAQYIMEAAMREVVQMAQAAHVNLSEQDIVEWYPILRSLHPEGCTSMLQDIRAGRPTEVDIFAGKMLELSAQYGVPVPVNAVLYHAIKTIEGHQ